MKWTQKQQEAIKNRGQNILVSAAAGSGKTAVLVERIRTLVIEERVPVDRILVVTFTKAAASEMKEKIAKALQAEIRKTPHNLPFLKEQSDKVYRSSISTFHSFAMDIIQNYFHVIGADPDLKVCDETEASLMKSDSMDETFRFFFEEDHEDFRDFLHAYGTVKNEDGLKGNLLEIYEKIQSMPETLEWLESNIKMLKADVEEWKKSSIYGFILSDVEGKLKEAGTYLEKARSLLALSGLDRLAGKVANDIEALEEIRRVSQKDFDQLREILSAYKHTDVRANKDEKEDYEEIKGRVLELRKGARALVSQVRNKYLIDPLEDQVELMNQTYPHGRMLLCVLRRFKDIYGSHKAEKNVLDFNDIEHHAIEILKNKEVAKEVREKYRYIFIDEYQDSNYLQEAIISRIKGENNLFMVGDIKQSIYRFRLAEPAIFRDTYRQYSKEQELSRKIDLNENFRSKAGIIDGINGIFRHVMEDYDDEAALYEGNPQERDIHYPVELHIVDSTKKSDGEVDAELLEMQNAELEALAAVKVIKESLGKSIFDHKKGEVRPLEKKDMVILMRGVKNTADIFYRVLSANDVPAYLDENSGYFDTLEIITFLDLLKVIDNRQQDIPLLSVLRSPIFEFSVEDLIRIRLEDKENAYFQAFEGYSRKGEDPVLKGKIKDVLHMLAAWKIKASYTPIHEFAWELMTETGYYAFVGAMPGGVQRQANLRAFVDKALAFGRKGNNTIFGLLRYIQMIGERKIEMGQVHLLSENDDLVRIMTIHKSKGLEYPMVIVSGLGRRFVSDVPKKTGSIHKDLGFAMTYVDASRHWYKKTLGEHAIYEQHNREAMEEEIRILYVAATRAKDKLVLMGTVKDCEKFREKMDLGMGGRSSYLDVMTPYLRDNDIHLVFHDRESLGAYLMNRDVEKIQIPHVLREYENRSDRKLKEEVHRILSYRYQNQDALAVRSKFSVSELNGKVKKKLTLEQPVFAGGRTGLTGAERGTIMHTVMEHLDFKEAYAHLDSSEDQCHRHVEDFIAQLVRREILTEEEASHVFVEKVVNFFKSPVGRRSALAKKLQKEKSFNILTDYRGTEVMVQGIIDCYFEEEGELILLDYKTNYSSEGIEKLYRRQMDLYAEALEKGEGRYPKETYLYLFSQDRQVKME